MIYNTEDSKHNLWVGVSSKGFNYVDRQTERFKHYRQVVDDPQSLLHNAVRAILLDHDDNLWVGSFLGLNVYSAMERTNLRYQYETNKDSLTFVICKTTEGITYVDNDFRTNCCQTRGEESSS